MPSLNPLSQLLFLALRYIKKEGNAQLIELSREKEPFFSTGMGAGLRFSDWTLCLSYSPTFEKEREKEALTAYHKRGEAAGTSIMPLIELNRESIEQGISLGSTHIKEESPWMVATRKWGLRKRAFLKRE